MSKKNNKIEVENKKEKETFFEKMKDKKYKAKVEIIGYGIFIIVLIVYLNIASMGQTKSIGNTVLTTDDNTTNEQTEENNTDLYKKINNNYEYDIEVNLKQNSQEENTNTEEKTIHYFGKVYSNNMDISKSIGEETTTYYKVDDFYYQKKENIDENNEEEFELVEVDKIYDSIYSKYIELEELKSLIDTSSLDHVTNYSSGKKESIYHLKVKDMIRSYQEDDVVEISIKEENDILTIEIDYSNLFKVIDKNIVECKVIYKYSNIDKVESFEIIPNKKEG